MKPHKSDKTTITIQEEGVLVHQENPLNPTEIRTTNLTNHETNLLLDTLLDIPRFAERAASRLITLGYVRKSHSPDSTLGGEL